MVVHFLDRQNPTSGWTLVAGVSRLECGWCQTVADKRPPGDPRVDRRHLPITALASYHTLSSYNHKHHTISHDLTPPIPLL